jgi:ABC-type multidrug transport system ATPase subunit
MTNTSTLVLSNITRAYRAGVPGCGASIDVLRGVSLDLRAGELVLVEGGPASGKTTLLLCAAGLLRPDSGTVQWPALGNRLTPAPKEVRYVGDRATTYGFLTVRESLAYAMTLREIDEPRMEPPAEDPIDLAGLRELTGTRVALLSRAERARFLVALALISTPKLFLVDDLTADCDAASHAAFAGCLARLAATGSSVVWAARAVGSIPVAGRAYELVRGKLRERGGGVRTDTPMAMVPAQNGARPASHAAHRVAEP